MKLYQKVFQMSLFRSRGRPRDTINFQVEILYFFGPTEESRYFGGNGRTQHFDPSKSIPKFEFFKMNIFPKQFNFEQKANINFT